MSCWMRHRYMLFMSCSPTAISSFILDIDACSIDERVLAHGQDGQDDQDDQHDQYGIHTLDSMTVG